MLLANQDLIKNVKRVFNPRQTFSGRIFFECQCLLSVKAAAAIFKAFFALKLEIFYFAVVDDTIGNLICVSSFTIITIQLKVLVNFHHYLLFSF